MTSKLYYSLIEEARSILKRFSIYGIEAVDLVNETYLKYGGLPEFLFIKKMLLEAGVSKVNRYKRDENKVCEDRRCKKCKELKESGWFRTWFLRGYLIHDAYCVPCRNEYLKIKKREYRKNKKEDRMKPKIPAIAGAVFLLFFIFHILYEFEQNNCL